jgi:hypothetical protein
MRKHHNPKFFAVNTLWTWLLGIAVYGGGALYVVSLLK